MDIKEIEEPKYIPFRCPVCNGFGTVSHKKITCHACEGKGYVVIKNSDRNIDTYERNQDHSEKQRKFIG